MRKLIYEDFESNESMVAEWRDIENIYKSEKANINKWSKLNYSTIYHNNFDKQKVQLTLNVFNEKIVGVLKENQQKRTATFVKCLINILNVRSPKSGDRLNDRYHNVFRSIQHMALMFEKMNMSTTKWHESRILIT